MTFKVEGLKELGEQLKNAQIKIHRAHMQTAHKVGRMFLRRVKQLTPVDTGMLRDAWKYDVFKRGDTYHIVCYNTMNYASHVEFGHRITSGGVTIGFKEGIFMMKVAMEEVQKVGDEYWQTMVERALEVNG